MAGFNRTLVDPPLTGCVYYDFDSAGDTKLVKDAEEIILDSMRAHFQLAAISRFVRPADRQRVTSCSRLDSDTVPCTFYQTGRGRFVECSQQVLNL